MKVLVTGHEGFIGQRVMARIGKMGHVPTAFPGNILDMNEYPEGDFDAVIHLASLITHSHPYSYDDFFRGNVEGTRSIISFYHGTKIVYVSTVDVTRRILSDYAVTKLKAEDLVLKHDGNTVIRLPSVFGPGSVQKKLIPMLFKKYCHGRPCEIRNNDLREYLFVDHAADQIIGALTLFGLITAQGFKVRNLELDKLIRSVCDGDDMPGLTFEERHFYRSLQKCLPHYREVER